MQVTINLVGGGSQTVAWTSTLPIGHGQATGAIGNGTWTLAETGNTGSVTDPTNPQGTAINPWTLTNTSTNVAIASVVLNGIPGNTVFDRDRATGTGADSGGQTGTPGSSFGITYTFSSESGANSPFTATVTYSGIVALSGPVQSGQGATFAVGSTATGVGDLWSNLTFAFAPAQPFIATAAANATWSFFQDTDTAAAFVPEPSSLALAGAALVCLLRRRRCRRIDSN